MSASELMTIVQATATPLSSNNRPITGQILSGPFCAAE